MDTPIPKRPSGYRQGRCDAPLQVEAFVDLECPFSKKAWPTLLRLTQVYSHEQVSITVYPIVLADHRQSWDVTKAAVTLSQGNPSSFWEIATCLYNRQKEYFIEAFDQKTRDDLYEFLANFASEFDARLDQDNFIRLLKSQQAEQEAKIPIRYAISRGVWSAPTFFINGSQVSQLSSSSQLSDWREVIEPLMET
jgi:protein-disulfide isomerase